jgi:hypothetical protein
VFRLSPVRLDRIPLPLSLIAVTEPTNPPGSPWASSPPMAPTTPYIVIRTGG